jgi:predicted 3-demethylubiquinone-9 3-methyltransferase (glyoxalase superfamily)
MAAFSFTDNHLFAMDSSFPHKFRFSEGISLVVECGNQREIDHFWNGLTKGGKESMCGWLKDQYGVSWQVVPAILGELMSDPDKAGRVAGYLEELEGDHNFIVMNGKRNILMY